MPGFSLSPYRFAAPSSGQPSPGGVCPDAGAPSAADSLPLGAIPLLAAGAPDHPETVARVAADMNRVYAEFVRSPEGVGFQGQVSIIGERRRRQEGKNTAHVLRALAPSLTRHRMDSMSLWPFYSLIQFS